MLKLSLSRMNSMMWIGCDNNIAGHETATAKARDPRNKPLPPHPNAIDATVCVATGVMTDRSTRHRSRPEHDACPSNATHRIFNVLAIDDRLGWGWIERETCKPQQGASSNPGKCR